MRVPGNIRSSLLAIAIVAVVVSTAYMAAGALYEGPFMDMYTPPARVTLIEVETAGLGGTTEHPHVPSVWASLGIYDLGVRVVGLRSEEGALIKLSLTHAGISVEDVDVYYYDPASSNWRGITFQDKGDVLVATLGERGGVRTYPGYDYTFRLIIFSNIDGPCQVQAWAESD